MPESWLKERARLGIDRFDEMWEGVLHVVPPPGLTHQRIGSELHAFFKLKLRDQNIEVLYETGVHRPGSEGQDYRVPDLVFFGADDTSIQSERGIEGAPLAILEIRSPNDETYEKFGFWADLGVMEIIVISPESRAAEVFRLAGKSYVAVSADEQGRAHAASIDARFSTVSSPDGPRLRVDLLGESCRA